MTPAPSPEVPWWLDHVIVPVIFTFFGALLGFSSGYVKELLDQRKTKTAFLRAVRAEVVTILGHLGGTLKDAMVVKERLEKGDHQTLHLVTKFHTAIYDSQLGKLKDVSDPVVIEIIRFYDKLSNLEIVKSHITLASFDLTKMTDSEEDAVRAGPIAAFYRSGLDEVIKRLNELIPAAEHIIGKLPD